MCKRGDVFFADLGRDFSTSIQNGIRPVLIVSNDMANTHSPVVTIVPLTGQVHKKESLPTHVYTPKNCGSGLSRPSVALAEQVSSISKSQLQDYKGHITDRSIMDAVTTALQVQIGAVGVHP